MIHPHPFPAIPFVCCLLALAAAVVPAVEVTTHDRKVVVVTDAKGADGHEIRFDFDTVGGWFTNQHVEFVSQPQHGTVASESAWMGFTYRCTEEAGFTGTDSFQYRLAGDEGHSNTATVELLLRPASDPAGSRVILLVRSHLLPVLGPELQRLRDDLTAEGFAPEIHTADPGGWDQLKSRLRAIYDQPGWVSGCVLVGDFPIRKVGGTDMGDLGLFNIAGVGDYHLDMWVSRMVYGKDSEWGDAVTLLRRHLDTNHAYRRGLLRPPHRFTLFEGLQYMTYDPAHENLSSLWPDYEPGYMTTAETTMRMGVSFHQNHGHGSGSSYEQAVDGADGMGRDKAFAIGNRCAILVIGACSSGKHKGVAAYQTATYEGFNVISVGNSKDASASMFIHESDEAHTAYRERLALGDCYGAPMADIDDSYFFDQFHYYGDLSLGVTPAPHNDMPSIAGFDADTTTIAAGGQVSFSVSASDADDGISHYQWWPEGFDYGLAPGQRTEEPSFSWTYAAPGSYRVRVRAYDHYRAHVDAELTVEVTGSASNQPPQVRLMTPAREQAVPLDHDLWINAWARDLDGSVSQVRALVDGDEIGSDNKAPFRITWNAAPIGSYQVQVEAIDDDGAVTASAVQTVHVLAAGSQPPLIHLRAEEGGGGHALSASASDIDGTIVEVVFLADGEEIGSDASAPYTCQWTGGAASLQAKAVDDSGAWSLSQPILVAGSGGGDNQPPEITAGPTVADDPVSGVETTGSLTASDPDGDDAALVVDWSVQSAPAGAPAPGFSPDNDPTATDTTVTFGAAGSYVLRATVRDAQGASTSGTVSVEVEAVPSSMDILSQ